MALSKHQWLGIILVIAGLLVMLPFQILASQSTIAAIAVIIVGIFQLIK